MKVYNKVYASIFDELWIQRKLNSLDIFARFESTYEQVSKVLTHWLDVGARKPYWLIRLPSFWLNTYPSKIGEPRFLGVDLSFSELERITNQLPCKIPDAQIITLEKLMKLLNSLYDFYIQDFPDKKEESLSLDFAESLQESLLKSGTVVKLETFEGENLYVLARLSYAPENEAERLEAATEDVIRFFSMTRDWAMRKDGTMRILEELELPSDKVQQAFEELDIFLREWADKYHTQGGNKTILQSILFQTFSMTLNKCSIFKVLYYIKNL